MKLNKNLIDRISSYIFLEILLDIVLILRIGQINQNEFLVKSDL